MDEDIYSKKMNEYAPAVEAEMKSMPPSAHPGIDSATDDRKRKQMERNHQRSKVSAAVRAVLLKHPDDYDPNLVKLLTNDILLKQSRKERHPVESRKNGMNSIALRDYEEKNPIPAIVKDNRFYNDAWKNFRGGFKMASLKVSRPIQEALLQGFDRAVRVLLGIIDTQTVRISELEADKKNHQDQIATLQALLVQAQAENGKPSPNSSLISRPN